MVTRRQRIEAVELRRARGERIPLGERMYIQLLKVFGPAQLGPMGKPSEPHRRTEGVEGEFELRRNSEGKTYLVRRDDGTPRA